MRLTTRDWIATALVAAGVVVAIAWFLPVADARSLDIRLITAGVLLLGMVASVSAVVPGFAGLIHGSRAYLLGTSALGLVALASAVLTLVNATETTLVVLVILMVALWVAATIRHAGNVGTLAGDVHR